MSLNPQGGVRNGGKSGPGGWLQKEPLIQSAVPPSAGEGSARHPPQMGAARGPAPELELPPSAGYEPAQGRSGDTDGHPGGWAATKAVTAAGPEQPPRCPCCRYGEGRRGGAAAGRRGGLGTGSAASLLVK